MRSSILSLLLCFLAVACSHDPKNPTTIQKESEVSPQVISPETAKPQGQNVGNGGDFFQSFFEQGRLHAIDVLQRITPAYFTRNLKDRMTVEEITLFFKIKKELQNDLASVQFIASDKLPADICPFHDPYTCACTLPQESMEVYLSRQNCSINVQKSEVGKLLLHETLHHFIGSDEQKVYRWASTIYGVWEESDHAINPHLITETFHDYFRGKNIWEEAKDSTTAVWTGQELLVWNPIFWESASFYNPVRDEWTNKKIKKVQPWIIPGASIPPVIKNRMERNPMRSVWVDDKMVTLISNIDEATWNEIGQAGIIYDPKEGELKPITLEGAPKGVTLAHPKGYNSKQTVHVIPAGNKVVVFGGTNFDRYTNCPSTEIGGIYDPKVNIWEPIIFTHTYDCESYESMVWASDRLVLWGRRVRGEWNRISQVKSEGITYDPSTKKWQKIASPKSTSIHDNSADAVVVSTGKLVFVYGGYDSLDVTGPYTTHLPESFVKTGGIFDPVKNTWQEIELVSGPVPLRRGSKEHPLPIDHSSFIAVWDGSQVVLHGADTRSYSIEMKKWTIATFPNQTLEKFGFTSFPKNIFSTGVELILWDGFRDGLIFVP